MKRSLVLVLMLILVGYGMALPAKTRKYEPLTLPVPYFYADVAVDTNGVAHACYMSSKKDRRVLYIRQEADGKWSAPVLASGNLPKVFGFGINGPNIAVSAKGVVHIQMGWKGQLYDSISTDGKQFTLQPVRQGDPGGAMGGSIVVANGHEMYTAWVDNRKTKEYAKTHEVGAGDIYFNRSLDDGKTYSKPVKISDATACVCCAPNVVAHGDTVIVAYRSTNEGFKEIRIMTPFDKGETWNEGVQVSTDDFLFKGCLEMKPDLAIDPSGRHVIVMWSAQRTYRMALSNDGGKTFGDPIQLEDGIKYPLQLMWSGEGAFVAIPANKKSSEGLEILPKGTISPYIFKRPEGYYKMESGLKGLLMLHKATLPQAR